MKILKNMTGVLGVIFVGIIVVAAFDLDEVILEKAEPLMMKIAQAKAAKKAAAQ